MEGPWVFMLTCLAGLGVDSGGALCILGELGRARGGHRRGLGYSW